MESTYTQCIAHIQKNDKDEIVAIQSNEGHCVGVAELAKSFADDFEMGDWGYVLGILQIREKRSISFKNISEEA